MNLGLRFFVFLCGCTPLGIVLAYADEISKTDPTQVLSTTLIAAFSALVVACFTVLFGSLLKPRLSAFRARRSAA